MLNFGGDCSSGIGLPSGIGLSLSTSEVGGLAFWRQQSVTQMQKTVRQPYLYLVVLLKCFVQFAPFSWRFSLPHRLTKLFVEPIEDLECVIKVSFVHPVICQWL
ncbi:hypothetical protein BDW22DRAFT_188036 [Trametopsis cervina]|nr:hypothetical protein BDW22DRAFT_188036 [Trametopsis cervina]